MRAIDGVKGNITNLYRSIYRELFSNPLVMRTIIDSRKNSLKGLGIDERF